MKVLISLKEYDFLLGLVGLPHGASRDGGDGSACTLPYCSLLGALRWWLDFIAQCVADHQLCGESFDNRSIHMSLLLCIYPLDYCF